MVFTEPLSCLATVFYLFGNKTILLTVKLKSNFTDRKAILLTVTLCNPFKCKLICSNTAYTNTSTCQVLLAPSVLQRYTNITKCNITKIMFSENIKFEVDFHCGLIIIHTFCVLVNIIFNEEDL